MILWLQRKEDKKLLQNQLTTEFAGWIDNFYWMMVSAVSS